MGKYSSSVSGYNATTAVAHFYNRDAENEIGFEMRMTLTEYNALSKFLEKMCKDVTETARQALAANVRAALPASPESARGDA